MWLLVLLLLGFGAQALVEFSFDGRDFSRSFC